MRPDGGITPVRDSTCCGSGRDLTLQGVAINTIRMSPRFGTVRLALVVPLALLASTCGGGGGGGDQAGTTCGMTASKLEGCHVIPKGAEFLCTEATSRASACYGDCFQNASCSDVRVLICDSGGDTALEQCYAKCARFTCKDGSTIDSNGLCDRRADCKDGSDEDGCPSTTFACKNGEIIDVYARCNGYLDCDDESDEAGCPTFTCKSGKKIPADRRCDGKGSCDDDSDELDCPPSVQDIAICK
jgi:hypothetical protein